MAEPVTDLEKLGAHVARTFERLSPERARAVEVARQRFLDGNAPKAERAEIVTRWLAASAVLAALAAVALAFTLRAPAAITFAVDGARGTLDAWLAAPNSRPLRVDFSDGTALRLERATRARVLTTTHQGARIALESGAIHAEVVHTGTSAWWLSAGPITVHVTGTRFDLSWDPVRERFSIAVIEGSVGVSGSLAGAERPVRGGETLLISLPEQRLELVNGEARANDGQSAANAAGVPVEAASQASEATLSPASSGAATAHAAVTSERGSEKPRAPSWRELAAHGALREAFAAAEAGGFREACQAAGPAELLLLGDAARLSGRPDRVKDALLALRERYPRDPRRAAAAFTLGKVAFDQLHAFRQAASWFSTCIREQPSGSLAREAAGRVIEALRSSGDREGAEEAARAYLARYPDGPHVELARSLLR